MSRSTLTHSFSIFLRFTLTTALILSLAPISATVASSFRAIGVHSERDGTSLKATKVSIPLPLHAPAAPSLTVTKQDTLVTMVMPPPVPVPGDTIKYTIVISNGGSMDATGVFFSDTIDINTTLSRVLQTTPLALADSYSTTMNTPSSVAAPGVLANDFGVPFPSAIPNTGATTAGGMVTVNANGSFTYTPTMGFSGTDYFNYTATNTQGSDSGIVAMEVAATAPPTAIDDMYDGTKDMQLTIAAPGVLSNDSGTPAPTVIPFTAATSQGGTVTVNPDGSFFYTPTMGFTSPPVDLFNYTITNGIMPDSTATVSITVNSPPVANPDSYSTLLNTPIDISTLPASVLDNDTGSPAPSVTAFGPSMSPGNTVANGLNTDASDQGGTVLFNTDGTFIYTPTAVFSGTDNFGYTISNGVLPDATTIVTVSVGGPPMANPDARNVTGNVQIDTSLIPYSVVTNDSGGSLTISAYQTSSDNGGNVVVNTTPGPNLGEFTYNPPVGFEGSDTFTYTLTNAIGSSVGTVTLTVVDMIWFIDHTAGGGGDGRLGSPFDTVANFNSTAVDETGDIIFLYELGGGNYITGITLLNTQQLIGQGVVLTAVTGITPAPGSASLPSATSNPTLVNGSGNAITLGQNNTIRGLTIGNTSGTGIIGTSVGTITVTNTTINGTGGGIDINAGTLAVSLDNLTASSSSNEGIDLASVTGSFTVFTGTISTTGPSAVLIAGMGGGVALDVTLQSVSADGGTDGISLNNTTGSFTVTGVGSTAGSGGTIQNMTANGVELRTATNVSLSNMNFSGTASTDGPSGTCNQDSVEENTNCNAAVHMVSTTGVTLTNISTNGGQYGINGNNVTNFSLSDSLIQNHGNEVEEHGIRFINLLGSALITNTTVTNSAVDNMRINNKAGVLNRLTVAGSTFDTNNASLGNNGILIKATGTASMTVRIQDSSLLNHETTGIHADAADTSELNIAIMRSTFTNNNAGINVTQSQSAAVDFEISNNTSMNTHASHAINVFTASGSSGGRMRGRIYANVIGTMGVANSGSAIGNGIRININGQADATIEIDNNTIHEITFGRGVEVEGRLGTGGLDVHITDNSVTSPTGLGVTAFPLAGVFVRSNDLNTVCAVVSGNVVYDHGPAFTDAYRLEEGTLGGGSTHNLEGTAGSAAAEIANTNTGVPVTTAGTAIAIVGAGTCNAPPVLGAQVPARNYRVAGPNDMVASAGIETGTQRVPGVARAVFAGGFASEGDTPLLSGENVNIVIGTLPTLKAITLTFEVMIDNPLPDGLTELSNQALVTGTNFADVPSDDPDTGTAADPTVTTVQYSALTIVKTATPVTYTTAGAVISYSYEVTNDGNVTISGPITVSDDIATDESCPAGDLAADDSLTCTASHTITQQDLDDGSVTNVAFATGTDPSVVTVNSPTVTVTVMAVQNPSLAIVKTATPSTYNAVGEVISYSYEVTNDGNVTISGPITVSDDIATDESCPAGDLAAGDSLTCTASHTITQQDLDDGSVTNVAFATGTDPNGGTVNSPTDTETVTNMVSLYFPVIYKNHVSAPDLIPSIIYSNNDVVIVVSNIGNAAVVDDFWVDLYIDPSPVPTMVNQVWNDLSSEGLVWGVDNVAALTPGGVITLTIGGAFYDAAKSNFSGTFGSSSTLYVQVDSANTLTSYGSVLENHEIQGGAYNNIAWVITPGPSTNFAAIMGPRVLPRAASSQLPPRPHIFRRR